MIGIKQYGPYSYRYQINGDEISLGHDLKGTRNFFTGSYFHHLSFGHEFQFDDNFGRGCTFNLLYPATPGDRPRAFDNVPGILQHSIYLNHQITGKLWKEFTLNWGMRLERFNTGKINHLRLFVSKNGLFLNPRMNLAYCLDQNTQIRLGYGNSSKCPALISIYPEPEYLDILDIVPVYRATDTLLIRDSLITTYIFDTSNPNLKGSRQEKFEISLDHLIGDFGIALTGFYSRRTGEPISEVQPYLYYQYYRPHYPYKAGESIADTLMGIYKTQVNGGWSKFDGIELSLKTRRISQLNMDFLVQAAYHHVTSGAKGLTWGSLKSDFIIPIYKRPHYRTQKLVLTYQVSYISKPLGIWICFTAQQIPHYQTKISGYADSLAVAYYDGLNSKVIPIPEAERLNPLYNIYRVQKDPLDYRSLDYPNKWIFNVRVSKSLFKGAEVSFYVNNFLDDRAYYELKQSPGHYEPRNPEIFYGIEISAVMDTFFKR